MYVSSPVFSKDNRYLYYVAAPISVGQVFKKDLVTDYTEALTTGEDWMIDLSRGLDPYHLLVTADRSGGAQLYEFNILNKKFKRLTFSEAECSKGVLSLQNQAMFYSMLSATASILVKRSFVDKTYEAITLSEQGAESPTFPDARGLIAFEQLYNEHTVIVFKTLDSGKETMLIAAPKGDYSCPSWASQPGF
jgi:Tol biopolymer transport system component